MNAILISLATLIASLPEKERKLAEGHLASVASDFKKLEDERDAAKTSFSALQKQTSQLQKDFDEARKAHEKAAADAKAQLAGVKADLESMTAAHVKAIDRLRVVDPPDPPALPAGPLTKAEFNKLSSVDKGAYIRKGGQLTA